MPEAKSRFQLEKSEDGIAITIPGRRSWLDFVLLVLGVMGFLPLEVLYFVALVVNLLSHGLLSTGSAGLFIWFALITYAFYSSMYIFLWQTSGSDIIEIGSNTVRVKRQILSFVSSKEYQKRDVKNLRISWRIPPFMRDKLWNLPWSQPIAFEYQAKTVRIGLGLNNDSAKQVLELMKKYFSL